MKRAIALAVALFPFVLAAQAPDFIFVNGKVFTGDASRRFAEAVAVKGNLISAVGDAGTLKQAAGANTHIVDVGGRVIIPGLDDTHAELPIFGPPHLVIAPNEDASWGDITAAISGVVQEAPPGFWVFGTIGNTAFNAPQATRASLDQITNAPVVLTSVTRHAAIYSTSALQQLLIPLNVADPPGGRWGRDSHSITGRAFEYAEYGAKVKLASLAPVEDMSALIGQIGELATRKGVTSMQFLPLVPLPRLVSAWGAAHVPMRVRFVEMPLLTERQLGDDPLPVVPRVSVGSKAWIIDGSPLDTQAAIRTVYPAGGSGKLNFTTQQIAQFASVTSPVGAQLIFVAAGDKAVQTVLLGIGPATPASLLKRRTRIERADGILPDLITTAKNAGVIVTETPVHYAERTSYPAGAWFPLKTLRTPGIPVAFGSDGRLDPWTDFQLAITRTDQAADRVTREQAIDLMTRGSAFAEFANDRGVIAPGKLADLVVLSQNVFGANTPALPATESVLTMIDGQVVFATIPF